MKIFTLLTAAFLFSASSFYGQCVKGNCFNGFGTQNWENGDYYEGSWQKGLPDGHGEFSWDNGDSYKGRFKNGKMNGQGRYRWKNGDWYNGDWKDGKMSGRGTYFWNKEAATYEGNFEDDKITQIETQPSQEVPEISK